MYSGKSTRRVTCKQYHRLLVTCLNRFDAIYKNYSARFSLVRIGILYTTRLVSVRVNDPRKKIKKKNSQS